MSPETSSNEWHDVDRNNEHLAGPNREPRVSNLLCQYHNGDSDDENLMDAHETLLQRERASRGDNYWRNREQPGVTRGASDRGELHQDSTVKRGCDSTMAAIVKQAEGRVLSNIDDPIQHQAEQITPLAISPMPTAHLLSNWKALAGDACHSVSSTSIVPHPNSGVGISKGVGDDLETASMDGGCRVVSECGASTVWQNPPILPPCLGPSSAQCSPLFPRPPSFSLFPTSPTTCPHFATQTSQHAEREGETAQSESLSSGFTWSNRREEWEGNAANLDVAAGGLGQAQVLEGTICSAREHRQEVSRDEESCHSVDDSEDEGVWS